MKTEHWNSTAPRKLSRVIRRLLGQGAGVLAMMLIVTPSLAESDLYLGNLPQSNVLFLIDDALSLDYEKLMDREEEERLNIDDYKFYFRYSQVENVTNIRPHCTQYNQLAYDPSKTYEPWWGKDSAGNEFQDQTDITSVPFDPYLPKDVGIADADQIARNQDNHTDLSEAFYLVWNDSNDNGAYDDGECPAFDRIASRPYISYNCVDHRSSDSYPSNECVSVSSMTSAEQTNFANWYAYHRKREYIIKYALAEVINKSEARIGIGFTSTPDFHDVATRGIEVKDVDDITIPVDPEAVKNKQALLDALFALDSDAVGKDNSQVRRMYEAAGNYFERDEVYESGDKSGVREFFGYDDDEPEPESPIIVKDARGVCQSNASIVVTGRYENGSDSSRYSRRVLRDNVDGDNDTDYDGEWVDGSSPKDSYADDYFDTLADVAMFFYERDLYPDVDNPDIIQRMSSHMVALGVKGTLDAGPSSAADPFTWPQRVNNHQETIDDMRHAAWNGRGEFHDPDNGDDLVTVFKSILFNIDEASEDDASAVGTNMLAVSSVRAASETTLYVSSFEPVSWEGRLLAYPIDQNTLALGSAEWDAADLIPAHAYRNIFSYNGSAGFEFTIDAWNDSGSGFSDAQKTALNTLGDDTDDRGLKRVAYIRGDQTDEQSLFRSRDSLLGDIVNSDAFYAADENFRYYGLEGDGTETEETYSYYLYLKNEKLDRQPMVYVGANDGMLHGIYASADDDVDTSQCGATAVKCAGEEAFAYIPKGVYSKLSNLTSPDYSHDYYVDGPPIVSDAFMDYGDEGGSRWGSVLLGSLGNGGAGVFALDVSDPGNFSAGDVLWDLDATDLPQLGSLPGRASIVKLPNDKWAAVFANGYDSANHKAGLYIVPLEEPDRAKFIDTEADGTSDAPNGLSAALPIDSDGDNKIDRVYAGDLLGNMWVFDLSSDVSSNWKVAFSSSSIPKPLFRACLTADCATLQPITSRPEVIEYTGSENSHIVLFGTGSYRDAEDVSNKDVQTFYGILDNGNYVTELDRSSLQEQTIELEFTLSETGEHRVVSKNSVDYSRKNGWYIDFDSSSYEGERIVSDPIVRNGAVRFFTFTVDSGICSRSGGESWYMHLNSLTGARTDDASFDVNGDGKVDYLDLKMITSAGEEIEASVSGFKAEGLVKTGNTATNGADSRLQALSSDESLVDRALRSKSLGRQSWIQVQ